MIKRVIDVIKNTKELKILFVFGIIYFIVEFIYLCFQGVIILEPDLLIDVFGIVQFLIYYFLSVILLLLLSIIIYFDIDKKNNILKKTLISFPIFILFYIIQQYSYYFIGRINFGYGFEVYIFNFLSTHFYYLLIISLIYFIVYGKFIKKKIFVLGNCIILFVLLTFMFTIPDSKNEILFSKECNNYVFNNTFTYYIYTSDDTEQSIREIGNYIYIPGLDKIITFKFIGINIFDYDVVKDSYGGGCSNT